MTAKLSDEQQRAISEQGGRPVEVIDPGSNEVYVLIAREHYERLRPLFEDVPLSREEQAELLRRAGKRAGWNDSEMDVYDRYDEHRSANA